MDKTNLKENMKRYYDTEASLRDSKSVKPEWKIKVRENFYNTVMQEGKKTLLELGAGAGYDSLFFMENGLSVTAVDLSKEMVSKCNEKGIEAYELDFYNLSSLNRKFDCIYAINTLLHVPKNDLSKVLNEIDISLNEKGLFYMGLYGGDDKETEFIKSDVSDAPRFFAFHSEEFLRSVLQEHFDVISFETLDLETDIFHSVILRKR